jgi:glycosyltransferase involved in cell wall biosynthesis
MSNETQARVSVVITTYNRAELLERSIRSVLDQTLDGVECIVADNASTDHTAELVASYADRGVQYDRTERNLGSHANFTRSLFLGTAPYVALLQDDDLMRPENLARKVALLDEHPTLAVAHAAFAYIDENDRVTKEYATWTHSRADVIEPGELFVQRSLSAGARINHSSAVLRRDKVLGERFDPADGRPCDLGFFLHVARRGDVGYIDTPLVEVRRHAASDTVQAGTQVLGAGGYQPDFEVIRSVQAVKRRFLAQHGGEVRDRSSIEAASRRWARRNLAEVITRRLRADGSARPLPGLLREAAAIEPSILASRQLAKLLARQLRAARDASSGRNTSIASSGGFGS